MKMVMASALVLMASVAAQAAWDGSGFYGTKEEAKQNLIEAFRITDLHSPFEQVNVYSEVPKQVSESIDGCRINNYSLEMSRANTAGMTPKTAAIVYETRSSEYDSFHAKAYFLVPAAEGSSIFAVDPTVSPCKVWEVKAGDSKTQPKKREKLTAQELRAVKEKASIQVGRHYVTFKVAPQGSTVDFWTSKPLLDSTLINMTGAGDCVPFNQENGKPYKNVVGFRTGICRDFTDFGYKGGFDGDSCLQIVRASDHDAAAAYFIQDASERAPSQMSPLLSSSVFSASRLAEVLNKAECFAQ